MIARLLLLLITLSASACGGNGPIFPVPSDLDDWVKASDTVDPDSDRAPILTDPVVTFQLERGDHLSALKFSDGLVTGQTRLLGFDIRADPSSVGDHIVDVTRLIRIGDRRDARDRFHSGHLGYRRHYSGPRNPSDATTKVNDRGRRSFAALSPI
ncbi:hypothetical protein [Ruegeria arenilitoris]|uniref:hypothetical protein n=1 Tax=Ruegeria arenilitoris TaxID=1173585 RepID=UPI0014798483|nr:hypothetical protein [Ruegeria arenilitoris]